MATLDQLKSRKSSVKNIGKITKAMQLVSTSKSIKAVNELNHSRNYYDSIESLLKKIENTPSPSSFDILPASFKERTIWIMVTSDLGLCGNFNNQIIKKFENQKIGKDDLFVAIGEKGISYLKKSNLNLSKNFNFPDFSRTSYISDKLSEFLITELSNGDSNKVKIIFTEFVNQLSYIPQVFDLYPLKTNSNLFSRKKSNIQKENSHNNYLENELVEKREIKKFISFYLNVVITSLLNESFASEQVARRVSMENATNNSNELVDDLTIKFNSLRQSKITSQITEIVGGVEDNE